MTATDRVLVTTFGLDAAERNVLERILALSSARRHRYALTEDATAARIVLVNEAHVQPLGTGVNQLARLAPRHRLERRAADQLLKCALRQPHQESVALHRHRGVAR